MSVNIDVTVPTASQRQPAKGVPRVSRYPQAGRRVDLAQIPSIAAELGIESASSADPNAQLQQALREAEAPKQLPSSSNSSRQLVVVDQPEQPEQQQHGGVVALADPRRGSPPAIEGRPTVPPLLLMPAPPAEPSFSARLPPTLAYNSTGALSYGSSGAKLPRQHDERCNEAIMASKLVGLKDAAVVTLARKLEYQLVTKCGPARDPSTRLEGFRKVIDDICEVQPGLINFGHLLKRFMKDLMVRNNEERTQHAELLDQQKLDITQQKDKFYEDKLVALLTDKRTLAKKCLGLENELDRMRVARDTDLSDAKEELRAAVTRFERSFTDHSHMKALIASIYKISQGAEERTAELEAYIVDMGLPVPGGLSSKASAEQEDRNKAEQSASDSYTMKRKLQEQLPIGFVNASREELELCRLSTQNVLVACASESQSSYKVLLQQRENENKQLHTQVHVLSGQLKELEEYIHRKRFAEHEREENEPSGHHGDGGGDRPLSPSLPIRRDGRYTPRPFLPFEVQPLLGIDLKGSTCNIALELATVGLNFKKLSEDAYQRARKLNAAALWMDDVTMKAVVENGGPALINTTLESDWDLIPHFLRTTVYPHVTSQYWTPMYVSSLILEMLSDFPALREKARGMRDGKMLAPRVVQVFERRLVTLNRLDATMDEMRHSAENVPFGYVVTLFLRTEMMRQEQKKGMQGVNTVILGVTASPKPNGWLDQQTEGGALHFRNRKELHAVEIEYTKMAYNLYFAATTYRNSEPMCDLFVRLLDGRVPLGLFDLCQTTLGLLKAKMIAQDPARIGAISYKQITSAIFALMNTQQSLIWRGAIYAVVQTMEEKKIPLNGKVNIADLLAHEGHHETRCKNPPQLIGASLLVKYVRKTVFGRIEQVYSLVEAALEPLVVDSIAMDGLSLLSIDEAKAALEALDAKEQLFAASKAKSETDAVAIAAARPITDACVEVISKLQKLSSNIHRPPPPPPPLAPVSIFDALNPKTQLQEGQQQPVAPPPPPPPPPPVPAPTKAPTKKKSKKKVEAAVVIVDEIPDMVEWFIFRHTLRQTLLTPSEPLFRPWADDSVAKKLQSSSFSDAAAPWQSGSQGVAVPMTSPRTVQS